MTAFLGVFGLGLCILAMAKFFAMAGAAVSAVTLLCATYSLWGAFGSTRARLSAPLVLSMALVLLGCLEALSHRPVWAFVLTFAFALAYLAASARVLTGHAGAESLQSPLAPRLLHRYQVRQH